MHLGNFGLNCMQCHGTNNWKSATLRPETLLSLKFNHDTTAFKLTGKHRMTDCKSCHSAADKAAQSGVEATTFKGTPQTCVACHAEPTSHKPHPKTFGVNCVQCHSTTAWKTATLVKHTFPMNHRAKNGKNSACVVCHPSTIKDNFISTGPSTTSPSYATYTCYGCHHHTPEKEAARHARRKVADLNNCAHCHPTGRGNKGRAAVAGATDIELCHNCPEAAEGVPFLNDFFPTSCPLTGGSHDPPMLLLSLGTISNVVSRPKLPNERKSEFAMSALTTSVPARSLWTTPAALRNFDLRNPHGRQEEPRTK